MTIMKSILLALHLVSVNLAAIGPLFCIGLIWRGAPDLQQTGKWLARWSCAGLLIGMLLGGLIMGTYSFGGAALNGTRFYNALLQIPHDRLWWGVAELAFYFLCMLPAVFFWPALMRRRWLLTVLLFLAATNLLYHFTPLFVVVGYLQGGTDFTPLTKPELRSLTVSPPVLARVVHHLLAGVAIVATVLLLRTASQAQSSRTPASKKAFETLVRRYGAWIFLVTLLEIPSGIWFLLQLPNAVQNQFIGGNVFVTSWFAAALLLVMLLLYKSFAVLTGETARRDAWQIAALLLTVILMMTGLLAFILPRYT